MAKIEDWLNAFRLRTLPLALSGILCGNALAITSTQINMPIFGLSVITATLLQILSNLANDYGDGVKGTDNHNRVGPMRTIQSGKISVAEMRKMIAIFAILSIFMGGTLIFYAIPIEQIKWVILFAVAGLGSVLAAIKYTVGKSSYGYRGLGDLFVFLFFGIVAVVGSHFLQTNQLDFAVLLPATAFGFFSTGVLNINNMRDIKNDFDSKKMTIPVRIGITAAKRYHYALVIGGWILLSIYILITAKTIGLLMLILALPPFILHLKSVSKNADRDLDPELKRLSLSTFALSILFALAMILF